MLPTLAEIRRAREQTEGAALRTSLQHLDLPGAPCEIWLKLENLQPIGSFKIRGAANAMAPVPAAELARGVLTASAGNMAQGVAWCARARGIPCTVIAPDSAPAAKLDAIERLGARIIRVPFERWWQTFQDRRYPGVEGTFIHAFDDPHVMAGNGTIGLEILEDLPDVDASRDPLGRRWAHLRDRGSDASACAALPPVRGRGRDRRTASRGACRGRANDRRLPSLVRRRHRQPARSFRRCWSGRASLVDGSIVSSLAGDRRGHANSSSSAPTWLRKAPAPAASRQRFRAARVDGKIVCIVSGGNIDLDRFAALLDGRQIGVELPHALASTGGDRAA